MMNNTPNGTKTLAIFCISIYYASVLSLHIESTDSMIPGNFGSPWIFVKWSKKGLVLLHGVCSYIIPFLFDVSWLQSLNSYYYMWTWDWEAPGWRGWKRYVSMDTRFSAASRLPFHPNTATQSKLISQRLITPNVWVFEIKGNIRAPPAT